MEKNEIEDSVYDKFGLIHHKCNFFFWAWMAIILKQQSSKIAGDTCEWPITMLTKWIDANETNEYER